MIPQASCPRCGRKLGLVAAGYYCMKCDMLLDKETLAEKAPSRGPAWLLPRQKMVWCEVEEGNLRVGDLSIPIRSIISVKPTGRMIHVGKAGGILADGLLSVVVPELQTVRVSEVEIQYTTETGDQTLLRIGTGDPAFLTIAATMTEPTKFCRECGAKIVRDSMYCEECGKKLA